MTAGKDVHDKGQEAIEPTHLPARFWELSPKEAALALVEANRSPENRSACRLALDDRNGVKPPARGHGVDSAPHRLEHRFDRRNRGPGGRAFSRSPSHPHRLAGRGSAHASEVVRTSRGLHLWRTPRAQPDPPALRKLGPNDQQSFRDFLVWFKKREAPRPPGYTDRGDRITQLQNQIR